MGEPFQFWLQHFKNATIIQGSKVCLYKSFITAHRAMPMELQEEKNITFFYVVWLVCHQKNIYGQFVWDEFDLFFTLMGGKY